MQKHYFLSRITIFILSGILAFVILNNFTSVKTSSHSKLNLNSFDQFPMRFEKNMGQTESETDFLFSDKIFELSLSPNKAKMTLRQQNLSGEKAKRKNITMFLDNANPNAKAEGIDELITKSNYFIGNDSTQWYTNIPNYEKVKYTEVYDGIDLVYYGKNGKLEYDFNISPGFDPKVIELKFEKETDVKLDKNGNLVIKVGVETITMQAPLAYQEIVGERELVAAQFTSRNEHTFGFEVDEYDVTVALVIDPILVYSTYLIGGGNYTSGEDIAVDAAGNIYITGQGYNSAFISKLHPDSSTMIYTTYLGGDLDDIGLGIAVDKDGYVYVTGETQSDNFPTHNAIQQDFGGMLWVDGDAFVTKLKPNGSSFVYSTYLGGGSSDIGYDIAVDMSGNAYVTGVTNSGDDFPIVNAIQSNLKNYEDDAFITKINTDGSAFTFSTYLGGSGDDAGYGIAVDIANNIYITGQTNSSDFPIKNAYQPTANGFDAFVTKMNPQGSALIFSTYLTGVSNDPNFSHVDKATGIAVNKLGEVYVTGVTYSPDFPTTNAVQPSHGGRLGDGFVTKFAADGKLLIFSTYLGGSGYDQELSIALDKDGNAFVIGNTQSVNFPTEKPLQTSLKGENDYFITGISSDGLDMLFSSYLGGSNWDYGGSGIAVGRNGDIYVTGTTGSDDFPIVGGNNNSTSTNAFLAEISLKDEEFYLVQVMQDSLGRKPEPVPNTEFGIYQIDLTRIMQ